MLTEMDQLRASFAPGDQITFPCRCGTLAGTIIRTNPKRALIHTPDGDYAVPYGRLTSDDPRVEERRSRMNALDQTAHALLAQHGLTGWKFRFDHSTRRAGCCNYHTRCISISFHLACNGSSEEIRTTLLHEIAHALVGRKHHHDAVWRAKDLEIGGTGQRCHRLEFSIPRYRVACENNCWESKTERRSRRLICRTCGGKLIYTPTNPSCSR